MGGYHGLPRAFAVKSDAHLSVRPQQRQQHAPAGPRIGEVMQHAVRLDQIEGAADAPERHDVRLRIGDVRQAELARLA